MIVDYTAYYSFSEHCVYTTFYLKKENKNQVK